MQDPLNDIITAINNINRRFYDYQDIHFFDDTLIDNKKIKHLELRFMNEFSTQFSKIAENEQFYKRFEIDFEVPKKFMWPLDGLDESDLSIRKTFEHFSSRYYKDANMLEYFTTIPDFLVHGGAKDCTKENQQIIIEAKVNPHAPKGEIFKDIFHSFIYSNKYKFKYTIIMLINIDKKRWVNTFLQYIQDGYYSGNAKNYKKIFAIFKASYESEIEVLDINSLIIQQCPLCGSSMKEKFATKGLYAGKKFFSCSKFPSCRGKIDFA